MMPNTVKFDTWDEGTRGAARFVTTVEITGQSAADLPATALHRFACYYILGHLNQGSLVEACQSLWDIYTWQQEQAQRGPAPAPQVHVVATRPMLTPVESRRLVIGDD
jgi:hypothetical protein